MNKTAINYSLITEEMKKHRKVKHHTKKDVNMILEAQSTGDWSKVHESKIYNEYGGHYCSLLEVLNYLGY